MNHTSLTVHACVRVYECVCILCASEHNSFQEIYTSTSTQRDRLYGITEYGEEMSGQQHQHWKIAKEKIMKNEWNVSESMRPMRE